MQLLEEAIRNRGAVYPGNILKVDGFLNHQIDPDILRAIGEEVFRLYKDAGVTKILTIEASGIAIAAICAQFFNVPMVFAKKSATSNISKTVYKTTVHSYTHNRDYEVLVSKDYLKADDVVLIIDDFLSNGAALTGLIDLVSQAGATLGKTLPAGRQSAARQRYTHREPCGRRKYGRRQNRVRARLSLRALFYFRNKLSQG